jgi:hypothetical protein
MQLTTHSTSGELVEQGSIGSVDIESPTKDDSLGGP